MSADRIAYFSNNSAASTVDLDFWTARYSTDMSTVDRDDNHAYAEAVLDYADSLLAANDRGRLAGMLTVAIQRLDRATRSLAAERERSVRHLTAYRTARQRAVDAHDALVDADNERDALRAALAEREDEVAELVARLARVHGDHFVSPLRWIRGLRKHPHAARVEFGGVYLPAPVADDDDGLPPLEFPTMPDSALLEPAEPIRWKEAA